MHRICRRLVTLSSAMAVVCLAGCRETPAPETTSTVPAVAPAPAAAPRKAPTDLEQLAARLVNQSAGITTGELVLISGGAQDQELLENIAVHVRKVGAFPLVTLNSDRLAQRLFFDVPDTFDSQADTIGLKLAENFNAIISVNANLDEGIFAGADPKRQAVRAKASQPVAELFLKRKVRQVEVGNGLYPTAWRAKRFGMSEEELTRTF